MRPTNLVRLALSVLTLSAAAGADCSVVWNTGWTNNTLGSSFVWGSQVHREVADDFDYTGSVVRLFVSGTGPFPSSGTPINGAWVRFYAWTSNGPGALQRETFLAANDPNLGVLATPETVDIRLATPFAATGKHFVSVQLDYPPNGGYWEPWIGSNTPPQLSHAWVRDNLAGGAWSAYVDHLGTLVDRDMSFELFGATATNTCMDLVEMPVPIPSQEYTILRDVDVRTASDAWAVGHYNAAVGAGTESRAFATHFDGSSWISTPIPSPSPYPGGGNVQLWAVAGVAANDVWAGGTQRMQVNGGWVNQQVLVEHWDGSSWSVVDSPLPPTSIGAGYGGAHVYDIAPIAANDVWFVGRWVGPYPGTPSTTPALTMRWNGSDFELVPSPVIGASLALTALSAVSATDIWAVGTLSSPSTQYPYVIRWNGSQWSHVIVPPAGTIQSVVDVVALSASDVWISAYKFTLGNPAPVLLHYNGTGWTQSTPPVASSAMFAASSSELYLASNRLHRFDGSSWSELSGPDCVPSPSFAALDGVGGELFAVGRQLGAGLTPLVARKSQQNCQIYAYCTSSITINGCVAAISGQGTPSASASSGFTLRVDNLAGQRQGLIFYGAAGQLATPWASGSTSFLCVKSPTQRLGLQSSGGTIGACDGALVSDWNAHMAANPSALGNPRAAGQLFDAQGWFRDPPSPKSTNLSNALHFVLAP
jgi:hypothetical protein